MMDKINKKINDNSHHGVAVLGLGMAGAGLYGALKKPKGKGLKPPTKKSSYKVVMRSMDSGFNDRSKRNAMSHERNYPGDSKARYDKIVKNVDKFDKFFNKTLPKVAKTMGAGAVVGTIASIMKPKPAGAGSDYTPEQLQAMLNKKK